MDNWRVSLHVKVLKSLCSLHCNPQPLCPIKRGKTTMEMIVQCPMGHVLIDKYSLPHFSTITQQIHNIAMPHFAEDLQLHFKVPDVSMNDSSRICSLDCHLAPICEHGFVHKTIASSAQFVEFLKPISGIFQLRQPENLCFAWTLCNRHKRIRITIAISFHVLFSNTGSELFLGSILAFKEEQVGEKTPTD
uniref:Uncharacterized protein n=1 Tax=Opuntia streptacantha TaxID=393608 RepID=A0A7C9AIM6_OPUST